jgi:hypothetical protein
MGATDDLIRRLESYRDVPWAADDARFEEVLKTIEAQVPGGGPLHIAVLRFLAETRDLEKKRHPAYERLSEWFHGRSTSATLEPDGAVERLRSFPPPPWNIQDDSVQLFLRFIRSQAHSEALDRAVFDFLVRHDAPGDRADSVLRRLVEWLQDTTTHEAALAEALRRGPSPLFVYALKTWWESGRDTLTGQRCDAWIDELLEHDGLDESIEYSLTYLRGQIARGER